METPLHIKEAADKVIEDLLPEKSRSRYWKAYDEFKEWCEQNETQICNEYVLLAYFNEKSRNCNAATMWSLFSMLKSTINIKENISIGNYPKLIAFLKRKKDNYVPKKSKCLEIEEIEKFIQSAPDKDFLLMKTALIIGMCAACRRDELTKMKLGDIKDRGDVIIVSIPNTKTKQPRSSCITEPTWINIVRKYISLRPAGTTLDRFFFSYRNNKCTKQPVGIHTFGSMPSKIATFLKLENPMQYTGHCFRRSSATILAGHGADITTIKRHGGWKSSSVAEGYIEDSLKSKITIAKKLSGHQGFVVDDNSSTVSSFNINNVAEPSTSAQPSTSGNSSTSNMNNLQFKLTEANAPNLSFSNCQIASLNINFK